MKTNSKIIATSVIVLVGVFFYFYQTSSSVNSLIENSDTTTDNLSDPNTTNTPVTTTASTTTDTPRKYKDGTYNVSERYMSPGGKQNLGVAITLQNDKILSTTVTNGATEGDSRTYQNFFVKKIASVTEGVSIDNLKLNTISGASLTTSSFNAALAAIRTQAKI